MKIDDEDIKEFFELFRFAVNQPDFDDLIGVISKELNDQFNNELNGMFKMADINWITEHYFKEVIEQQFPV
jgi:hypothetical protein